MNILLLFSVFILLALISLGSLLAEYSDNQFQSAMDNLTWHDLEEIKCDNGDNETNETTAVAPCEKLGYEDKLGTGSVRMVNAVGYIFIEAAKPIITEARESEIEHGNNFNYNRMITLLRIGIWVFVLRYLIPFAIYLAFLIKWIYETVKSWLDKRQEAKRCLMKKERK